MAKWFITMETGYYGETAHDVVELDGMTNEEAQDIAHSMALDNAEMYGRYPTEDCEDMSDEEIEECASDNIEGFAVPYDPEKHDMYAVGGSWN